MATENDILSTENVVLASSLFVVFVVVVPTRIRMYVAFAMIICFLTVLGVVYAPGYLFVAMLLVGVHRFVRTSHGWQGLRWYSRGVRLQAEGRHSEALTAYDRSLDHLPRRSDTWHNRGMVLGELGRHGDALQSYDKALGIRADDPDTWNNRAVSLSALGRLHDAIASYDRSLALRPSDAEVIDNRALALDKLDSER